MTSDITTLDSMGRAKYKIMKQFPFRKQPQFPFLESLLSILTGAHSLQHTKETLTDNFCLFFCNWSCSDNLQCATTNILFQGSLVGRGVLQVPLFYSLNDLHCLNLQGQL